MNKSLEIKDVQNTSLEASDDNSDMNPQLVAQFTCQYGIDTDCIHINYYNSEHPYIVIHLCCSAILMFNVTHAALKGISVTTETPNVSAIILQQCSYLYIQSLAFNSVQEVYNDSNDSDSEIICEYEIGIIAYESSDIEMASMKASNFTTGLILYNSSNTKMINVSAVDNRVIGMDLIYCTATSMMV